MKPDGRMSLLARNDCSNSQVKYRYVPPFKRATLCISRPCFPFATRSSYLTKKKKNKQNKRFDDSLARNCYWWQAQVSYYCQKAISLITSAIVQQLPCKQLLCHSVAVVVRQYVNLPDAQLIQQRLHDVGLLKDIVIVPRLKDTSHETYYYKL